MNLENNQRNLYPLGKDKDIILKTFAGDENIVSLILPKYNPDTATEDLDIILKRHLYDRISIPEFQPEAKTYICVESNVISVNNDSIKDIGLIINVFSHESLIELSRDEKSKFINMGLFGNRVDCIIDCIDRCLNGKRDMGIGRLRLKPTRPVGILQPTNSFYGKSLEYIISDFNTQLKI